MPAVLLATLLVLGLPWAVSAQQPSLRIDQPDETMRFKAMDRNRDGIITRDEWDGTPQSFRVHDWNRDGMLSGDELRIGATRTQPVDEYDFDPSVPDEFFDWTETGFTRLDRDRNNRITPSEWFFNREAFYRADRDRNNVLTRDEFVAADIEDDREDRFEYLDVNRNNRIERREWHGSTAAFNALDRNRNGVLSRAEVVGTANPARSDQFASLDTDRNGVIAAEEWYWSRRSFNERDLNRDGVVTRREFNATAETTGDATRTPVVRVLSTQAWNATNIFVRAGEVITLQADGSIGMSDDPGDTATPAGSVRGRFAKNAPVPRALAGGLLARIGNSAVRFIGGAGSFTAPVSGELQLGVNDDHLLDNTGEFRVTVRIDPPTR